MRGGRFSASGSLSSLRVRIPADSRRLGWLLAAPVHHLAPASSKSRNRLFPVSSKELRVAHARATMAAARSAFALLAVAATGRLEELPLRAERLLVLGAVRAAATARQMLPRMRSRPCEARATQARARRAVTSSTC